jgi:hypothetical protein
MAFTFWRGAEQLGELHVRESGAEQLSAVLVPAEGSPALAGVMQTRFDIPPARPVFEHPLEPLVVGDRPSRAPGVERRSQTVPLRLLSEAERVGIPTERQLTVRDGAGQVIGARLVMLQEFRPAPGSEARVLAGLPTGAFYGGGVWLVSIGLDSAAAVA